MKRRYWLPMVGLASMVLGATGCQAFWARRMAICDPCCQGAISEGAISLSPFSSEAEGTIVEGPFDISPEGEPLMPHEATKPPASSTELQTPHPTPPARTRSDKVPLEEPPLPRRTEQPGELKIKPSEAVPVPKEQPKAAPGPDLTRPAPAKPAMKPASLSVKVSGAKALARVGEEVAFDIIVENQGEASAPEAELTATLGENMTIVQVTPMLQTRIEKNVVTFPTIRDLRPVKLNFQIVARVAKADGGMGRISVELKSPILTAGPLKDEVVVQISR